MSRRRLRDTPRGRGNGCNHRPRAWGTLLHRPHRRQPLWIPEAIRTFRNLLFYEPQRFPELTRCLRKMQTELFVRTREQLTRRRSELLECLSLVMAAMLVRCDALSKRVGWHNRRVRGGQGKKRDFRGLTIRTIAKWTGRDESSVKRAVRILRWLGWVPGPGREGPWIIPQPVQLECRERDHVHVRECFAFYPAIRRISPTFFELLGPNVAHLLQQDIDKKTGKTAAAEKERRDHLAEVVPLRPRAEPASATIVLTQQLAAKLAYKPPDG